jgi:hypothetical protein
LRQSREVTTDGESADDLLLFILIFVDESVPPLDDVIRHAGDGARSKLDLFAIRDVYAFS